MFETLSSRIKGTLEVMKTLMRSVAVHFEDSLVAEKATGRNKPTEGHLSYSQPRTRAEGSGNSPSYDTQVVYNLNGIRGCSNQKEATIDEVLQHSCKEADYVNDLAARCLSGELSTRQLEAIANSCTQAVKVRREVLKRKVSVAKGREATDNDFLDHCPLTGFEYAHAVGVCCENMIGHITIPVGIAGPLLIDGIEVFLPIATTEGALVASICRGCKAANQAGGVTTELIGDAITRSACLKFPSLEKAYSAKTWLETSEGHTRMRTAFRQTSKYIVLKEVQVSIVGELLYPRFVASTGDAMGMNMISVAVEKALVALQDAGFRDMTILSLSGNTCTDKKPSAMNWVRGRGKHVVAQARIPSQVIRDVLRTTPATLLELNVVKNLTGSAVAGTLGGFNTHASNIVSGVFLATGQDVAQVVESSNCITTMSEVETDLLVSVTMPSIEVGTVGGGTNLPAQASMLELLDVRGTHRLGPGLNARRLARVIAAAVLVGELSTCSALATADLASAHLRLNRKRPSRMNCAT
ncbi:hypothetical protein EYZ11_007147 [Aspergillus tanneri]|uniref:3-hydroxy-3-methylglutaryl coenzyme A reductase n=1 Tax=Aspergillus tanneri TaxID=1220188 RepID=A0A4S3JE55_9EURO|nr:3-hydroxy-3-methylglutaryl-coenzyme A (HMG-CoA) reductase isozyme [Aspergillus tanneri]KAA8652900.1 3-hydroxy-3-methylglutaryl-coenzyme A (HMG-CoA) reductase isozyme [Aspergillus tanneri]THC93355.1 hypothetical protein EYZ11_007147 [Aspergillus tanneri]